MSQGTTQIHKIRELCLQNAENLLKLAEDNLNKKIDNICFHLALLALEEIGKSILVTIGHTVEISGKEKEGLETAVDDHIKKIFWALWGNFLKSGKYSKEEIEMNRNLATTLHKRRLFYLYVDPNASKDPNKKMEKGETERLVKLTRTRLELEKNIKLRDDFTEEDIDDLKWFFNATEDAEKRKFIFGKSSIEKLKEFEDGKKWIKWIRDVFRKNEEEMRRFSEQELKRQKPSDKEKFDPKYKMRIRIQSQSHSVRNNAFAKWNKGVHDVKIYKADKKNIGKLAKSELLIDFIFPKAVPIHGLWDHSFFIVKTFLVALNVATRGLFWWNVPKDIESFFEYISDLEADKQERIKIGMRVGKRLAINWDEAKMVLNQEEMSKVSMMYAYFLREHKQLQEFLKQYALGLTLFSKTDIHLRLEVNAFEEFFKSFKEALRAHGDWDGKSDVVTVIKEQFKGITFNDLDKTIQLGVDLVEKKEGFQKITLTEVVAIKLYCDYYLHLKAKEYFNKTKTNRKN